MMEMFVKRIIFLVCVFCLFSCKEKEETYVRTPPKWLVGKWQIVPPSNEQLEVIRSSEAYTQGSKAVRDSIDQSIELVIAIKGNGQQYSYSLHGEKELSPTLDFVYAVIDDNKAKQLLYGIPAEGDEFGMKPTLVELLHNGHLRITTNYGEGQDVAEFTKLTDKSVF